MNLGPFTIASTYQYLVVFNAESGVLQEGDGDVLNYTSAKILSTTGDQWASGVKSFYSRPNVTGEDILSSPQAQRLEFISNEAYNATVADPYTTYVITNPPPDGPFFFNISVVNSGSHTLGDEDYTLLISGNSTVGISNGPSYFGREFRVKNISASVSTISGIGGCLIDGAATYVLSGLHESASFQSDGINWYVF